MLVLKAAATKSGESQAKSSWHRAAAQAGLTIADPGCLQPLIMLFQTLQVIQNMLYMPELELFSPQPPVRPP